MKTPFSGDTPILSLPVRDRQALESLSRDTFQSARARKRAHALLLLAAGTPMESVVFRTGTTLKSMQAMLERLATHGVHGAIFDRPHQSRREHHDPAHVAELARSILGTRPPPGHLRWGLDDLTEALRSRLPEGPVLTRETVRQVLKNELGIKSIRFVEPFWYQQVRKMA